MLPCCVDIPGTQQISSFLKTPQPAGTTRTTVSTEGKCCIDAGAHPLVLQPLTLVQCTPALISASCLPHMPCGLEESYKCGTHVRKQTTLRQHPPHLCYRQPHHLNGGRTCQGSRSPPPSRARGWWCCCSPPGQMHRWGHNM
jgi:hypothetical protein